MEVIQADEKNRVKWNQFVAAHFPPVGAFMQSWEWGDFKTALGYPTERYALAENGEWQGVCAIERHRLPFGFAYGYAPRGPVFARVIAEDLKRSAVAFHAFVSFFHKKKEMIFARIEPPLEKFSASQFGNSFHILPHYVQPRFNSVVDLTPSAEELLSHFPRDVKQDLKVAERRGIRVELLPFVGVAERAAFRRMAKDTAARAGKAIFPSEKYFDALFASFPFMTAAHDRARPALGMFFAFSGDEPVAANLLITFGTTATYLYGASLTGKVSSKASAYLHFMVMQEAKRCGFLFYDLGGVDDKKWSSLTYFKKKFGGATVSYAGNADVVISPGLYRAYSALRRFLR